MARAKRRQDGSLRPAVQRHRHRREQARRRAWLAEFKPGDRGRFFNAVDMEHAKFARPVARQLQKPEAEVEELLAKLADRLGWMTLRTRTGRVVGIGPRKR